MKKGISRFLAGLLAAALMLSPGNYPVHAGKTNASAEGNVLKVERTQDTKAVTSSSAGLTDSREGKLEVKASVIIQLTAGVKVLSDQDFQIELRKGKTVYQEIIELPSANKGDSQTEPACATAGFSGLDSGVYELSVSGKGYVPYRQEIEIEDNLNYRLQIYTGNVMLNGTGLLIRGDVDGDGDLDQADAAILVDAIEEKKKDAIFDLNGDGTVDLLDLNYLTEFLGKGKRQAVPEQLIPTELVKADLSDETKILSGTLQDMMSGRKELSVMPQAGALSENNPVQLMFDFSEAKETVEIGGIILEPSRDGNGVIAGGEIEILQENGETMVLPIVAPDGLVLAGATGSIDSASAKVGWDGTLIIDLGGRIAVKHVTIRITRTMGKNTDLAKISSVEFVNDMEKRIPDPEMNIPSGLRAVPGNRSFVLSWGKENNVTAYEVMISDGSGSETRKTVSTQIEINRFGGKELENNKTYTVKVQSLNGEWKSGYSGELTVIPKTDGVPDAPDNVSVRGGYKSIVVSYSKLKDADSFNIYYKEEGLSEFQKITGVKGLSCQINDLKEDTKYIVYVTGVNELGEGPASLQAADKTLGAIGNVQLPAYKLINTSNGEGVLSSHIKSATIGGIGAMVDSSLDKEKGSALGIFDNAAKSYVECKDWDYGGAYPNAVKGVTVELDDTYTIGMAALYEPVDIGVYTYIHVSYWDENGVKHSLKNVSISQRNSNGRRYYLIKFNEPVKTSKLQIGVGRYGSSPWMVRISEIRLYEYDSLEKDIMDLYADDLHIVLKDTVTEELLESIQERLDTKDSVSGEYHPEREMLKKELDMAKQLLETPGLGDVVEVNPVITSSKDSGISVGGLNAWQPLGIAAASGEQIVIYVGNPGMKTGSAANVELVFTQQHAESSALSSSIKLKIGRNEVTLPRISATDKEKGGALYVQYTGNKTNDQYAVRVSGGVAFPVLRLYGVPDEKRAELVDTYVKELVSYVDQLKTQHEKLHSKNENESVNYAYDIQNCILNMTDIQADKMMLSIPASQVLAGLGTQQELRAARLTSAIKAMDGMMTLFYQHKGLTDSFAQGTEDSVIERNHIPYRYLNIRYMKMFAGAFMYAAGNHIGIEWGSAPGMVNSPPVESDDRGRYKSGRYFGWGIAHEIGHEINQSAYALAEVTNNYFSVLAQAKDDNSSVRFQYPEVFKKVTSNTWGYSGNVFTQLGMYWQLHLAYDRDYNYKTYGTYQEIVENLFFARVDSYARDTSVAPGPEVPLVLTTSRDQNLMRLASAAAERDLTEFFTRWGLLPDSQTRAYMEQFPKEERAIYYVDDTARVYEIENGNGEAVTGRKTVSATVSEKDGDVTLQMTFSGDTSVLQGYEIVRVFVEQGEERRETAGFTQNGSFTDHASFAANHVITYEVTAIDKFMNRSAVFRTASVKISGDGKKDKTGWTLTTNMASAEDKTESAGDQDPCEPKPILAVEKGIDNNTSTMYTGSASGEDPYIILELNQVTEVTALRYTAPSGQAITDYRIEISKDGVSYTKVKEGTFKTGIEKNSGMVYFENGTDPWVCTYDAAYVRLTAIGQAGSDISIAELDLYGPSGDNVELMDDGIGKLKEDYIYDIKGNKKIPAGSVVFTGSYKGNPAYNVVLLYDENGDIVGGTDSNKDLVAQQIILADDPKDAMLGEVSDGRWIYWIEASSEKLPDRVRAELYRVDNALTNEGQRLVSDTEFTEIPESLPEISLK